MNILKKLLQKYRFSALYFIIGISLLTGARWTENYFLQTNNTPLRIKRFAKVFNKKEKYLNEILEKTINKENNDNSVFSGKEIARIKRKNIAILEYHDDSLVFWSDNSFKIPGLSTSSEQSIENLQNGWYFKKSKSVGKKTLLGLILLKNKFNYENKFLKNEFPKEYKLPSCYSISKEEPVNGNEIHSLNGDVSFYLSKDEDGDCFGNAPYFLAFIYFGALLAFLFFIRNVMHGLRTGKSKTRGLIIMFLLLGTAYLGFISTEFSELCLSMDLFSPYYCSISKFIPSLGEFLLLSIFILFYSYSFSKDFHPSFRSIKHKTILRLVVGWGWLVILFAVFLLIFSSIKELIINSSIEIKFQSIHKFTYNSYISFITICLLALSLILLARKIINLVNDLLKINFLIAGLIIITGVFLIVSIIYDNYFVLLPVGVFLLMGLTNLVTLNIYTVPIRYMVISVFIMSFFLTSLIITVNHDKEKENRKVIAVSLGSERDPVAELLFSEIDEEVQNDPEIAAIMKKDIFSVRDEDIVYNILKNKYFKGYLEQYNLSVVICQENSGLIVNDELKASCFDFFEDLLKNEGSPLNQTQFMHIGSVAGQIRYFGAYYYQSEVRKKPTGLFIELNSKIRYEQQGYPELLLEQKLIRHDELKEYSYAKYYKGRLVNQDGDFPYTLTYPDNMGDKEFEFRFFGGYEHLIYKPDPQNIIVIGKPKITFINYLISFSYLFVFLIVLVYILQGFEKLPKPSRARQYDFKSKIQWSLLLILLISMISIGGGAIYLSIQQYKDKHFNNLSEKMLSVYVELEHKLSFESSLDPDWSSDQYPALNDLLMKFSNVFYTDINLYDREGNLLATSRPEIFDEGLTGKKMDVMAFKNLKLNKMTEFIHNEKIGNLSYMSGYMPFTNYNNKLLAYLNLPYFSRENVIAGEISTLVVGIVNFSIVLILVIMGLAIFISTRITNPLRMIQKEFSRIELGKEPKIIHYEGDNEIGSLIGEYNRMVKELARSVEMLAKSERESAWREMAKQIAHEIKNPLTPMKLSIQQLQRAWRDKLPDWDEKLSQFSSNLIEQIEHLSSIASEFSNFAEISRSEGEVVNIVTKIEKAVELFSNEKEIDFIIDVNDNEKVLVYFDKEKMIQVFSNLINNAIQSIPEGRKGRIHFNLDIKDKNVVVKVSDNGSGIPKEIGDKLFEPNFTTKSSGMGLGLAIVKNIMRDFGGKIWYETEIGKGSVFIIEIPHYLPGENNGIE